MKPTLRIGSRGDDVRTLQFDLYNLGADNLSIDGIFGPKTDGAVREFQSKTGLKADGICGPLTWAKIEDMLIGIGREELVQDEAPEYDERTEESKKAASDSNAKQGRDDGEITLKNEPVQLWYPAGQRIVMPRSAAMDLSQRIQEKLMYTGEEIEIIAPVGLTITATAVAAVNIWQQIEEAAKNG